jgi:glycosyltransferase involved in cell wall biosynthesis
MMENKELELDFCLLIPCYNNKAGLIHSLSSIKYPPNRFLVLVVDDGSTEPIEEKEVSNQLPVKIISLEKNQGITNALNTGLLWIRDNLSVKYIARLDCDDTCDPERFNIQVSYMDAHPEVALAGSWCLFVGRNSNDRYVYKTPTEDKDIRRAMYYRNVFMHPTVIFRKDAAIRVGLYPENFELAEDYALFWKLMDVGLTFVDRRLLVTTRIDKTGISFRNRGKQLIARQKVVNYYGNNRFLKVISIIRLGILFLVPKRLLLPLKILKGRQLCNV